MSEAPAEAPAADEEGERIHTLDELNAKVDRLFEMIAGKAEPAAAEEPASVQAEVQRELKRLKDAEDRKAARDREKSELDAKLAALEEKVAEKPPKEFRKVTTWMGWRDKGDE